jgi:flagellar motility protein MotE (MotC chaperone)
MKVRFLPLLIVISLLFLVAKVVDIIDSDVKFTNKLLIADISVAADVAPDTPKPADDPNVSTKKPEEFNCNKGHFSEIELDILKNLAKRREELDRWSKDVLEKETILKAAEIKADQKITQLSALKDQVADLLKSYNEKEDMKISSLVQIYETMKPKDAAKILESLDMDILLQVLDKMNKSKTAPILAQMNTQIATDITTEFVNQKKLPYPTNP